MSENFLLIIDGSSLLTTQFFGNLPREILFAKTEEEKAQYFYKIMKTSTGVYTNAITGFLKVLFKILKEQKPRFLAVTFDKTRDTFRREMYPPYKGNRSETIAPLRDQFVLCERILPEMGIPVFMSERYEADDYSGTLAKMFENEVPVRILTKDHDYLQLITDKTLLWMMQTDKKKCDELFRKYNAKMPENGLPEKVFVFDSELCEQEFSVKPTSVASLKGLQGDSSDNIPGVKGVGPDTAAKLIKKYEHIGPLFEALKDMTPEKEKELKALWKEELGLSRSPISYLLREGDDRVTSENGGEGLSGKASAFLSETLAEIKTDIPLDVKLSDLSVSVNLQKVEDILKELEIHSIPLDFTEETEDSALTEEVTATDDFTTAYGWISEWKKAAFLGLSYDENEGLTVSTSDGVFRILPGFMLPETQLGQWLSELKNAGVSLFTIDGKYFYKKFGVITEDVTIAAYLMNPLRNSFNAEYLRTEYTTLRFAGDSESGFATALIALKGGEKLLNSLKESGMDTLYREIELRTMACLSDMENAGIQVKKSELGELSAVLLQKIDTLSREIYEAAGEEFNINSPKKLADVLFVKLGLPYPKKNAKSFSTNVDILDGLKADYPIVAKVLEYRAVSKLRSTYAEGLKSYIGPDGRIHGTFNQTVTATGRISSTEPNLQNIPVKTELGREIRKVFVPREGCVFIDADYSQIELRVMAHMSGDTNLINAYNESRDIHRLTASEVFHVPFDEVTPEERSRAKAVNFGIIYGISAFSLSDDIGVSRKEAEEYIERYFQVYPEIRNYLNKTIAEARENGTVKTLYGRIRPVPELRSESFHERSFGERIAMNSPIQGTAADIMKIAVIHVNEALKKAGLSTQIVLQVHDEIILEAPVSEADQAEEILVREMENAAELSVKLKVEAKRGYSWYETK